MILILLATYSYTPILLKNAEKPTIIWLSTENLFKSTVHSFCSPVIDQIWTRRYLYVLSLLIPALLSVILGQTYDEGWDGSKWFRYCAYGFYVKCEVWGTKKFRCEAAYQRNSRSYKPVVLDDGTSTKYVPCYYYSDCILDNDNFDRQSIKYPRLEENSPLWG